MTEQSNIELLKIVKEAILAKKGYGVTCLDLSKLSDVTDYYVLASGSNHLQVKAISDNVEYELGKVGKKVLRVEGYKEGQWILLDFGEFLVHIFVEEERQCYNLEQLWQEAPEIEL